MIGVMMRSKDCSQLQALSSQVFEHWDSIAGIDSYRIIAALQDPDVIVLECVDRNDVDIIHRRGCIIIIFDLNCVNVNRCIATIAFGMVCDYAAWTVPAATRADVLRRGGC